MSNYLHLWVNLFDKQIQISNIFIFIGLEEITKNNGRKLELCQIS